MDPSSAAMLLDPKAYKKQHKSTNGISSTSDITSSPLLHSSLLDSTSTSTSSSPALSRSTRASSEPYTGPGTSPYTTPTSGPEDTPRKSFEESDAYSLQGRASAGSASSQRSTAASSPRSAGKTTPAGTTFDPRQLLSPREYNNRAKRPRMVGPGVAPAIAPQFVKPDGPSLEFTSGFREENAGSESSEVNTPKSGSETPGVAVGGGHGSLIENMYGVEERSAQPQKRVKVEKELNGVTPGTAKSSFATSGGGSDMGEFMKGSSGTNTPASGAGQMIDLTLDDDQNDDNQNADEDDDMVIVGSKDLGAEEVCYGRLDGATVLAHRVPRPPKSVFGSPTSDWPSIRCTLSRQRSRDTRIEVMDSSSQPFGILDYRISAGLAPLLDSVAIKVRTQARLDVRRKKPDEWPGQPCSDVFRISINLYGPRKLADGIGRHLGQKNVWLGTPNSVEAGFATYNPHAEKRLIEAAANNQKKFSVTSETRTIEEINSAVTKMFDHLASAENLPEREPPDTIKTPMLPHQKQALWFMLEKEKPRRFGPREKDNTSLWRIEEKPNGQKFYRDIISGISSLEEPPQALGGLLADMMGLGKTLSILSLVLSTLPGSKAWAAKGTTEEAVMNNLPIRNIKTTLLVSPLSAVGNWITQVKEHLKDGALSWYLFHGPTRTQDAEELGQYDLVITTYSTILSEISGKSSKRSASPLSQVNMFRIVLDEAHAIREQNAAQSQAIFSLNADRRWSVTGTPIQNRLEDLASVTKFLRLRPYDEKSKFMAYIVSPFKSESPHAIKSLRVLVDSFTLRRVKDRIDLPPRQDHVITLTFSEQEKMLHEFFRKESNVMMNVIAGERRDKMRPKMYHLVLKAMMVLRQISAHGKELLDQKDRARFRGLSANDAIDLEEESDTPSANLAEQKAYEMLSLMEESSANVCAQCGNSITMVSPDDNISDKNAVIAGMLPCYDILCADCFRPAQRFLDERAGKLVQLRCPVCEGTIPASYSLLTSAGYENYQSSKQTTEQSRKQVKVFGQYEGPHTKTKALLSHLLNTIDENKRLKHKPPIKSVVFSSWTSHLDLIELALEDNGIYSYTRLDGTMTLRQRNASLDAFRDDDNITILLATLGAGGVGLNLTAGSRVYVMEPQYNPAAVAQAVDRVHRLGQKREVIIVHFIMKDSIEEKIAELAKKKQKLADMSLNQSRMDKKEKAQERMREYRNLFT